jgi:A/G-specific adenine glycosylase
LILPDGFDETAVSGLLAWFDAHGVNYPWRDSPDPWGIWVSEVMLQQTTAGAAASRYSRWMNRFPDPESLAAADEKEVLREWEGLGYYSRARNLAAAAAEVIAAYGGRIPRTVSELRKLPGVGDYIAAAVASFAFGERAAAIDANGRRIAQRLSASTEWTGDLEREFRDRLEEFMPRNNPGLLNAAVMQLGQLVCTPKNPECTACPLANCCRALASGLQREIPAGRRVTVSRTETSLAILLIRDSGGIPAVLVRQKLSGTVRGLWGFPGAEEIPDLEKNWVKTAELKGFVHTYTRYREQLHPSVYLPAGTDNLRDAGEPLADNLRWVSMEELEKLPMPSVYRRINKMLVERIAQLFRYQK